MTRCPLYHALTLIALADRLSVVRITVVGSGDAFNAGGRLHSCYLIEDIDQESQSSKLSMVDFGATSLAGLHQLNYQAKNIDTFVFTHLHGDHIFGVPFLIIDSTFASPRTKPLKFVGPVGLKKKVIELIDVAYGLEILEFPTAPTLCFKELEPNQTANIDGLILTTFPADHMDPPHKPLCLRFENASGISAAFSGDTEMGEGLKSAAKGVDLLVAECSSLAPPAGRHCTWEDWQKVLPSIGAKRIVLTHLGKAVRDEIPRLLNEAPHKPRVDFADDGQVYELG